MRRARRNELTMDDYAGTTISLTNPGGIGTVHSMPRLMHGAGHDRRRRRDGAPGRVRRHERRAAGRPGHQQDHHADLDVRPPHHPGRPVGRVPQGRARAAARRARLLRRDLRRAAHPVRAGPVDPRRRPHLRGPDRQGGPGHRAHPRVPGPRAPDGRHRPAGVPRPPPPRPRRTRARADPVGPGPHVPGRRLRRPAADAAARHPRRAAGLVLPPGRGRVHAHPGPGGAALDPGPGRAPLHQAVARRSSATSWPASTPRRRSRRSCRPSTWGSVASRSRARRA